jgi:hypothetical protein
VRFTVRALPAPPGRGPEKPANRDVRGAVPQPPAERPHATRAPGRATAAPPPSPPARGGPTPGLATAAGRRRGRLARPLTAVAAPAPTGRRESTPGRAGLSRSPTGWHGQFLDRGRQGRVGFGNAPVQPLPRGGVGVVGQPGKPFLAGRAVSHVVLDGDPFGRVERLGKERVNLLRSETGHATYSPCTSVAGAAPQQLLHALRGNGDEGTRVRISSGCTAASTERNVVTALMLGWPGEPTQGNPGAG